MNLQKIQLNGLQVVKHGKEVKFIFNSSLKLILVFFRKCSKKLLSFFFFNFYSLFNKKTTTNFKSFFEFFFQIFRFFYFEYFFFLIFLGIAGEPHNEAHGGYAYCGYAALVILKSTHLIDNKAFLVPKIKKKNHFI